SAAANVRAAGPAELPPLDGEAAPGELQEQIVHAGRAGHRALIRAPRLRAARGGDRAGTDERARLAVQAKLDATAGGRCGDTSVKGGGSASESDVLDLDVVATADLGHVHAAASVAAHLGLEPGRESDGLGFDALKRVQVLDGLRSRRGHRDLGNAAVGLVREFLDADRAFVAAAAG